MSHDTQQEIIEDCQALSIFLYESIDAMLLFSMDAGLPDRMGQVSRGLRIVSDLLVEKLETVKAAGKAR